MPSAVPKTPPPPPVGTLLDDGTGALELVAVLGCGGYGVVYRARDTRVSFPTFYAVKCLIRPNNSVHTRQRQLHLREIALHQLASSHPHVVSLHRVIDPPNSPYTFLVMDYCSDGDLFTMILHNRRYLGRDSLIKHVFLQLLNAVEYCHSLGIYHRDLKPENVLCFNNGLNLAITDFGLSTTDKISSEFRTGSVYHMSPECQGGAFAAGGTYSPPANDIWSLGIILLNLCTGRNPWKSATASDPTFAAYLSSPSDFLPSVLPISQELNALLLGVLDIDWTRRTSLKEFKQRVKNISTFYSEDVVFEGSMARCPWEIGMNLDEDTDENGHSRSVTPPPPATPPADPTLTQAQHQEVRVVQPKSGWSSDSESDMVFASPSVADDESVSLRVISSSSSDDEYHPSPPSPVATRKRKPQLKINIQRPSRFTALSPGSSADTYTFHFSALDRSNSPDLPEIPNHDTKYNYAGSVESHHESPKRLAPSISEADSASYHTSLDTDFVYPSDSVSGVFKVIATPESEKKTSTFARWSGNYMHPAPATPQYFNRDCSDYSMESGVPVVVGEEANRSQDSDDSDGDDAFMSSDTEDSEMQLSDVDTTARIPGTEYVPSWSGSTQDSSRSRSEGIEESFLAPQTQPIPIPARSREPIPDYGCYESCEEVFPISEPEERDPRSAALEKMGWEGVWGCWGFSSVSEAEAIRKSAGERPASTCSSNPYSTNEDPFSTTLFSPSGSSLSHKAQVAAVLSPKVTIETAYRTTLSSSPEPPKIVQIPLPPPPPSAPTVRKETKSQSRSLFKFAFPRAFSSNSSSSSTNHPSRPTTTSNATSAQSTSYQAALTAPKGNTEAAPPSPVVPSSTTTNILTRRSRFSSTGYGPRARALDLARSRMRSRTQSRSMTRSPSPRSVLRSARNWFLGAAHVRLFERGGAAQVAAAA